MEKDSPKPILKFEPGSRQPFILYLISITIISAIIVIVCLFTSGMTFSDKKAEALGDVNLDGKVDTADVTLLSQYFTGGAQLTDEQKEIADVDNNGEINLGNIFEKDLEEIINSQKAQNIYNGFSNRNACEELCKRCSFVRKF